jgi:DNA-binding IclR family transcriptional regulator
MACVVKRVLGFVLVKKGKPFRIPAFSKTQNVGKCRERGNFMLVAPAGLAHKVMKILETLMENPESMDLREIASKTDIPKSTVHRVLSSLEEDRWVSQHRETRKYQPGARILIFADTWRLQQALVIAAEEPMKFLVEQAGETTVLVIPDGEEARCIHLVESPHALKFSFCIGGKLPLHAGAVGKVILAHSASSLQEKILSGPLEKYTQNTLTDPVALRKELDHVRQQGFSVSVEEINPGGTAVGAPVFFREGHLVGGLIISGPKSKFERKLEDLAPLVMETAKEISKNLGGKQAGF